jgi:hypothetical protein
LLPLTFLSLLPRPWQASRPDVLTAWAFRPFRPPGQLDALAAAASDVTFPAGHRVFEEGGRVRAFEFDAAAIRVRCAADPEFGAEFRERLLRVLASRLQGTRTRLIAGSMSDGA